MNQSGFCQDPLWDLQLTWFTDNPDFTTCFHQTVLVYVPSGLLLLLAPLQIHLASKSKDGEVPWSLLTLAKFSLSCALLTLSIIDLIVQIISNVFPVYITASVIKIITYGLVLTLQWRCKKRGLVTSGVLLLFWTLSVVAGAFTFRSVLASGRLSGEDKVVPLITATIQYPLVIAAFFLSCWADPRPKYIDVDNQVEDLTPERYASAFSQMIFAWVDPLMRVGWKKQLYPSDLWSLTAENRCSHIVPQWDKYFDKALEKDKGRGKMSILGVMFRAFGPAYSLTSVIMLLLSVLQFANPQIVNLLIDFVSSDDPNWKGYLYTVLIVIVTFMCTILNSQAFYREYLVGLRIRTGLISAIYRKSLRLSNAARKQMTVGETTNLMQIDTQKFLDLSLYLNLVWTSPLQIILAMYFLWQILGPSSLAGLAVMILMGPLNAIVARKMKALQIDQMKNKDKRNKMMDEILNGMKIIKLYAWEASFRSKVNGIRDKEIAALKKIAYLNAAMTFLWVCAPTVVALASFATYVLVDPLNNVLDANTAFVSLTLFNLLRVPLNVLPILIVYLIQCQVSLKRINKFINSDELDPEAVKKDPHMEPMVHVENASFAWSKHAQAPTLDGLNLEVKQGQLVAIVGQVGSGKSSLLSAILGEMVRRGGHITQRGRVAYVPQQAWIQNGTVEYNIHFGKAKDVVKYKRVLDACALVPDLKMLPGGDQTEIGEKGINLSGGQKQRISMARAVYSEGELYLLDDPLSAVDAHVGAHMFEKVIGSRGLLKEKTRVLVTHSARYLPQMDRIFVMKDGRISEQGNYQELLAAGGEFADFLVQYLTEEQENGSEEEDEVESLKQTLEQVMGKERLQRQLSKAISIRSKASSSRKSKSEKSQSTAFTTANKVAESIKGQQKTKKKGTTLIEEEKAAIGGVKLSVYLYYASCIGLGLSLSSVILYLIYTIFNVFGSIWLSIWSTDPTASTDIAARNKYLSVYGVLGLLQAIFIMVGTVTISVGTLNAATKLHGTMLTRILRSPMSFFDTTPLGRILNRFSKDIDIVDVTIPGILRGLIGQLLGVLGTIIIVIYSNVYFLAVVVPLGAVFYFLQKFYVSTARQVKRLESISRSPIYSHFGETVSGATTIRAYGMTSHFIGTNEKKIDENQVCYYPTFVSSRWLAVRLEVIGNVVILFAALFAVLARDSMDPGQVGLSLSYALTVTQALSFLVTMVSEVETNMVGVERIKEYQEITEEAPLDMPEQDPPPEWPQHGVVKFDNYQTRYRAGLDLVLKGISCDIMSGEKIGIVGRTGAGKSSLTLGLFRIIESAGGSIYIDGENIGLMGLATLRSRLTIIPQDPVLFSGSLRMNLDPFDKYSDDQIWTALEHAHLKAFVANLPGDGLFFEVNEGGENLSVGQRQLVCLARALLRKTKVLILDEATAAIDLETDDLIQETIRREFADCTVLTIAHRLNTIMDSSRVMVLDAGKISEFDAPEALLRNEESVFYGMAKEAGLLSNSQQQQKEQQKEPEEDEEEGNNEDVANR